MWTLHIELSQHHFIDVMWAYQRLLSPMPKTLFVIISLCNVELLNNATMFTITWWSGFFLLLFIFERSGWTSGQRNEKKDLKNTAQVKTEFQIPRILRSVWVTCFNGSLIQVQCIFNCLYLLHLDSHYSQLRVLIPLELLNILKQCKNILLQIHFIV